MKVNPLAVIVPVNPTTGDSNARLFEVWQIVTELLLPKLGKDFSRFEPAAFAWKQKLNKPYGVVLGCDDPALFFYCYSAAKAMQQHMIKRHMRPILENLNPIIEDKKERLSVFAVELKDNGAEMGAHMLWHVAMIAGDIQPDCGLYFAREKEAYANDELEKKVLENLERYALCVVNLVEKEDSL